MTFLSPVVILWIMIPQDMQEWRKRMGWTQEQAAARLGVERGTVNRYENGKRTISQTVSNLCGALLALDAAGRPVTEGSTPPEGVPS